LLDFLSVFEPSRRRVHLWAILLLATTITAPLDCIASETAETPTIWKVGFERDIKRPSEAAKLAKDGDIIEIDAGNYTNDYVSWRQNNLTIRGVGGMAHIRSVGLISNGKGIWITNGDNTTIENIEFSGATVRETNGAGIRHQGGDLTLHNTFFHDNEFSVLTGKNPTASVKVTNSKFWFQKRATRFSHGIYIGAVKYFSITGSHFKGTELGHQIKSRAFENHILYNRIEDVGSANSSRLIDLPNCGLSFIIGNDMHQAASSENLDAIGYGAEQCEGRTNRQQHVFVINNSFVNEARLGSLLRNHVGAEALIANNIVFGRGGFLFGKGDEKGNLRLKLNQRRKNSWELEANSRAIDASIALPITGGFSLLPTQEFTLPVGTKTRMLKNALDVGAREKN